MKKIIFGSVVSIIIIFLLFITYLSIIGIETNRFNNHVIKSIQNFDKDLKIQLRQIKIVFDPLKFQIQAKTIGSKLKYKGKTIEIENIKAQISINSILKDNFLLKDLEISTKSLEIKNLVSFIRNFKNTPELYVFEKIVKRGYLISDIKLEFDQEGKIKNNYKIRGFIKNAKISALKKYNLDNINLIFNLNNKIFIFEDVRFSLNNLSLFSKKIEVQNDKKDFIVKGIIENSSTSLDNQIIETFIKQNYPKLVLNKLNLNSKNQFSFKINKNLKIEDLQLDSKIQIDEIELKNSLKLSKFFPNSKNQITLNNHKIQIDFSKNNLIVKGEGDFLLQNKKDNIRYKIKKKNNLYNFDLELLINENPFIIKNLGFKKDEDTKMSLNLKGTHFPKKKTEIKEVSLREKNNKFLIKDLILNKDYKIKNFKEISMDYIDTKNKENKFEIFKKKKNYVLSGTKFNADSLIESLLNNDNSNNLNLLESNLKLKIQITKVYLDEIYNVNNINGFLNIRDNEITNAELNASFSNNKILKFTIKSNPEEKVTTLFLDEAEPIVKRYKFIKGYENGSLDFYSSKKGNKSLSNLKVYNFRLRELPTLTKLLTLASLQGIADILSGDGITFEEFEMNFSNQNNLVTIHEIYAIGPAISILMDGYIEKNKVVSLRGSLVPATTINKAIGSIPVLGKILVGSKTGEGVFGVSFKIKGAPNKLETTVNPIKTLTPRFITRTLEKIKKN